VNFYHNRNKKNKKLLNNQQKLNKDICNIGNKKLDHYIYNKHKMLWKLVKKNNRKKNNINNYKINKWNY
jgi:hypothetical protein